jgi:hypothetical protein
MKTSRKILFECCRLLMMEIQEQKRSREALIRALIREEAQPVKTPTDDEVNERIIQLQEVARQTLKNNLTNQKEGSKL